MWHMACGVPVVTVLIHGVGDRGPVLQLTWLQGCSPEACTSVHQGITALQPHGETGSALLKGMHQVGDGR